jgi:hypothetical protein
MSEEQIQEILKKDKLSDVEKELMKIYPNGVDLNKIDKRIKEKIKELTNKNGSIEKPIQVRKG